MIRKLLIISILIAAVSCNSKTVENKTTVSRFGTITGLKPEKVAY